MKRMNKLYTINFLLWSSKDLIFKKIILPKFKSCYYSNVLHVYKKKTERNVWTTLTITQLHNRDTFNTNSQFPIYRSSILYHTIWKARERSNFSILNQTSNSPIASHNSRPSTLFWQSASLDRFFPHIFQESCQLASRGTRSKKVTRKIIN